MSRPTVRRHPSMRLAAPVEPEPKVEVEAPEFKAKTKPAKKQPRRKKA